MLTQISVTIWHHQATLGPHNAESIMFSIISEYQNGTGIWIHYSWKTMIIWFCILWLLMTWWYREYASVITMTVNTQKFNVFLNLAVRETCQCKCILSWASGKLTRSSGILYRTYKGHLFLSECSKKLLSHTVSSAIVHDTIQFIMMIKNHQHLKKLYWEHMQFWSQHCVCRLPSPILQALWWPSLLPVCLSYIQSEINMWWLEHLYRYRCIKCGLFFSK